MVDFCRLFLFSRLIGLRISMCCDSVSFDFLKPARITVARFTLVLSTCLDIKIQSTLSKKTSLGSALNVLLRVTSVLYTVK